jgi:hypothetical protein
LLTDVEDKYGEIADNNKRLNRQCLAWNEMSLRPCFLLLKWAELVFRENPGIRKRILAATGK